MTTYIVAKANQTAMAFVARAGKERSEWIILERTSSYNEALGLRDYHNASYGRNLRNARSRPEEK